MSRQLAETIVDVGSGAAGAGAALLGEAIPFIGPIAGPVLGWLTEHFLNWAGHKIIDSGSSTPAHKIGVRGKPNDLVINHKHAANLLRPNQKTSIFPVNLPNNIPLSTIVPPMDIITPGNISGAFTHGIYQRRPIINVDIGKDNSYYSPSHQGPNAAFGTSGFTKNDGFPIKHKKKTLKYNYVI